MTAKEKAADIVHCMGSEVLMPHLLAIKIEKALIEERKAGAEEEREANAEIAREEIAARKECVKAAEERKDWHCYSGQMYGISAAELIEEKIRARSS